MCRTNPTQVCVSFIKVYSVLPKLFINLQGLLTGLSAEMKVFNDILEIPNTHLKQRALLDLSTGIL